MGTAIGDFLRAKRDATAPADLGLPTPSRSRAPGLRRSDVATRAGVSVEYLTRLEQGRDRHPSPEVLMALGDALSLNRDERVHLRNLSKLASGGCVGISDGPGSLATEPGPSQRSLLKMLGQGLAFVSNPLTDVLDSTPTFRAVIGPTGLLDGDRPNIARFVFGDPRSRDVLVDWSIIADEFAFTVGNQALLSLSRPLVDELTALAGEDFTSRIARVPQRGGPFKLAHPHGSLLTFIRTTMSFPEPDVQTISVWQPADEGTEDFVRSLRGRDERPLRAV